jgi:Ca-activated chloride channel family protein
MPSVASEKKSEASPSAAAGATGTGLGTANDFDLGRGAPRSVNAAAVGNVQIGSPQVNGGLPAQVVRNIVQNSSGRMRACYENGLRRNPSLAGRVSIRFVIGQNGQVLSSMDGGSGLGDPGVVACVVSSVRGLSFPQPGAGFVTVLLPVTFSPGPFVPPVQRWFVQTQPTATHRAADDSWLSKGEDTLTKLRNALEANPTSRRKYEDLARGLLAHGRFEDALATARRFVSMDPDLPVARELLAYAAVANDDAQLAASAVDTQVETDPTSVKWHVRGARAFEALGDERRACAHWRSLAQLQAQSDEFVFEALRCRARVLDDRDSVLADARGMPRPGKLVTELLPQVEASRPPPFSKSIAGAGQFEAEINCSAGERCPTVFVVSPNGTVFSPFTPTDSRSSAKSVAFSGLRDGTYMTLLTGGSPDARGEIELRALGSTKRFSVARGGRQTVAATRVTFPNYRALPNAGLVGEGFLMIAR